MTETLAQLRSMPETGKKPRCQSKDEWIKETWYIVPTEYYLAIIKNEITSLQEDR